MTAQPICFHDQSSCRSTPAVPPGFGTPCGAVGPDRTEGLFRGPRFGIAVACVLLSAIGSSGCSRQQAAATPSPPPPPAVTVSQVAELAVADRSEYVGRTEAVSFVDLRARVTGFLTSRNFEEGADVRTGDLLYVIEQDPYRIAVEIAQATVAQTEATLENADRYLERLKAVETSGGTSQANLDTALKTVAETKALLEERRARLEQARLNLDYTEIRAPINGRIGRTSVHVGNLVGPESGVLATIIQLDPIWATFPVSEREFLALQRRTAGSSRFRGLLPTLRLVDGSAYPHPGRLDFQDNRVSPDTGTILIRAVFPNPALLLRPGQFVTVVQTERTATARTLIPQSAVQRDQVGAFVMTVDAEHKAQIRRITLGDEVGRSWAVLDGLQPGEWVIIEGLQKVTPGSPVNPAPAEGAKEASSGAE